MRHSCRGSHVEKQNPDDPIGDYVEWTEHRYDPGHCSGGHLSPATRSMQRLFSSRDKRVLLVVIIVAVIVVSALRFSAHHCPLAQPSNVSVPTALTGDTSLPASAIPSSLPDANSPFSTVLDEESTTRCAPQVTSTSRPKVKVKCSSISKSGPACAIHSPSGSNDAGGAYV